MIGLDDIGLGAAPPQEINVVVVQAVGTDPFRTAVDPSSGAIVIDRLYDTAMRAPGTLGLIPRTRTEGGGALGAVLPIEHTIAPGLVITCRPVGVVYVAGAEFDQVTVLAVPVSRVTARFDRVRSYADVPAAQLRQLSHYLSHVADLEDDQEVLSAAWGDVSEAHRTIEEAARRAARVLTLTR